MASTSATEKVLAGKTVLVTGGTRGIGRVIAQRLAGSGAMVALSYANNTEAAERAVGEIADAGGEAFAIKAEFGTEGAIDHLVSALLAELQRRGHDGLDVLVNNVGGGSPARIEDVTADFLDLTFDVNFRTPFLLTRELMPRLRDNGRVVNISSATVRVGYEDAAAYVCCKAALDTFSRLLAKNLGPRGITVNSVAVGRTVGGSNEVYFSDPANARTITDVTALARLGTEADIAGVVHALVSPDGAWITGQVIDATGGYKI